MQRTMDNEKLLIAKVISIMFSFLGIIMFFISYHNNNLPMIIMSISYGTPMIITYSHICIRKNLNLFYLVSIALIFLLEFSYLKTGGTEGFGIIWLVLIPFLSLYLLSFIPYAIVNIILFFILALAFWTPLRHYCYEFKPSFEIRFPIVIFLETLFGLFLKNWIQRTENSKAKLFDNLTSLQKNLHMQVIERTRELEEERNNKEKLMLELTKALAATIDAKDKYTSGHSLRVAQYSREIAKRLGYTEKQQDDIFLIGLLHDIGKIAVPDEIINKTSKLTDEEYEIVKKHPISGSEILSTIESMPEIKEGARWHHERWDGKGYPDNLLADEIPTNAQIISVADSYDAMTSTRSYRRVLPQKEVRKQIELGIGTQFNPDAAKIMLQLIDEDVHYAMHE